MRRKNSGGINVLSREMVQKIAHLARLEFTDAELDEQLMQLNMIVDMMSGLSKINTDNIEPLNHIMDITNVFREDVVENGMPLKEVFQNAPEEIDDMFQVPRIV